MKTSCADSQNLPEIRANRRPSGPASGTASGRPAPSRPPYGRWYAGPPTWCRTTTSPTEGLCVVRSGHLDMRAQAEVPSALRTDTPTQFGANLQVCPRLVAQATPDRVLVVRAAEMVAAIRESLDGGYPRETETADPPPDPEPWSPPRSLFRRWHGTSWLPASPARSSPSARGRLGGRGHGRCCCSRERRATARP
jgi:hypothetical protein